VNAFARSNLAVALLRLVETQSRLATCLARGLKTETDQHRVAYEIGAAEWGVREAIRLVEAATALDEMESVDTLPSPPDSGARRIG
jgi:hypothetical protein